VGQAGDDVAADQARHPARIAFLTESLARNGCTAAEAVAEMLRDDHSTWARRTSVAETRLAASAGETGHIALSTRLDERKAEQRWTQTMPRPGVAFAGTCICRSMALSGVVLRGDKLGRLAG
jgi:hypothetical protein